MKQECLEYLVCVGCKQGGLNLKIDKEDFGEVMEGALTCDSPYPKPWRN